MRKTPGKQTIPDFVRDTNLDHSMLVGYYGGGNFGDELLLETLLNFLSSNGKKDIRIYYLHPEWYREYHKDFDCHLVDSADIGASIKQFLKSKNIVVGGGGLWGLDMNPKAVFLSIALFFARFTLRKRVYLLGVGYYSSTSRIGNFAAWCAAHAARHIIARDQESYDRFRKITKRVSLDKDLSHYLNLIDPEGYKKEIEIVAKALGVRKSGKTLLVTIRKFKGPDNAHYQQMVQSVIDNNPDKHILLGILEPKEINPEGYEFISQLAARSKNVVAWDFRFNPIGFYLYLGSLAKNLIIISPHYHGLAVAVQNSVPFLPLVYDNKSQQLLRENGINDYLQIGELTASDLQKFIDREFTL